ncbi:hypothetical protein DFA_07740 [Cavenderia fasciculata]|uniref:Uncharacterized protein n=1 Tax=Cavenderia fasciculata TaxID=261658 RepID=F4Q340_CACFS|nr:uncharacterized protein DFA_07740 [Cavenderia fasciculata]EGG16762.1 hypothetical protein DFA_07740 [Cavenderia fasciculata]|eukprot:XP_004355236.1 hypothetical protein DFA_07740 [Cavenderia fasciculata]
MTQNSFLGLQIPLDKIDQLHQDADKVEGFIDQQDGNEENQQDNSSTTTNISSPTTTTTKKEEKKKKKKKNKNKIRKKAPYVEPGDIVKGVNDEHTVIYDYGNVINVKNVDTNKEWNEAILGKYLKDAGFVKGLYNSASIKSWMTPIYIQFANKLLSHLPRKDGKSPAVPITGHGQTDFNAAFNTISSETFGNILPNMPSSYKMMTSLLVVAAYVLGFSGFGRGGYLPNIVKHTLVENNAVIPRDFPDLARKVQYHFNVYYGLSGQQVQVVWDKTKLTKYLENNVIRKYTTTKYPATELNITYIITLCKSVMSQIYKLENKSIPKDILDVDIEKVELVIDMMGSMAKPYWNEQDIFWYKMRMIILQITLIAFQTGIPNYVHIPLIDSCLKQEIIDHLENPIYEFKKDLKNIVTLTGNGQTDFDAVYSYMRSGVYEKEGKIILPSYTLMATLLVAAAYVVGFNGFGRGTIPNIVKNGLVENNAVIPLNVSELFKKINFKSIVWDKEKMAYYLPNNGVRKYNPTKYEATQNNIIRMVSLCQAVFAQMLAFYISPNIQEKGLHLVLEMMQLTQSKIEKRTAEMQLDKLGRLTLPLLKLPEPSWIFTI